MSAEVLSELKPIFHAGYSFSPAGISIIEHSAQELETRFGDPEAETYLSYHNHHHSIAVALRGLTMHAALQAEGMVGYEDRTAELLALGCILHDTVQYKGANPGFNEQSSAQIAVQEMSLSGEYTPSETGLVSDGIIATTFNRDAEGRITQPLVCEGAPHPVKLLLPTADTYGILLGGLGVMVEDATNFYMEINGLRTLDELSEHRREYGEFLQTEAQFLRDRIKEFEQYLNYHFVDEAERGAAQAVFKRLFKPGEVALKAASIIEAPRVAAECIDGVFASGLDSLAGIKHSVLSFLRIRTD